VLSFIPAGLKMCSNTWNRSTCTNKLLWINLCPSLLWLNNCNRWQKVKPQSVNPQFNAHEVAWRIPSWLAKVIVDYDEIGKVIDYDYVIFGQFNWLQLLKKTVIDYDWRIWLPRVCLWRHPQKNWNPKLPNFFNTLRARVRYIRTLKSA